jgi:3-hydroxyacyl-[acyl-carrier-protein] dehydratase
MRFNLIDRIVNFEAGARLTAIKNLSLAEEYLADHFPGFPVMPGVLMLESMVEAGAWLVRASRDFAHSMVVLREARNVKFANFVEPGCTLDVSVQITRQSDDDTQLDAQAAVSGKPAASGKLTLSHYNLADTDPQRREVDRVVVQKLREHFSLLYRPAAA